MFKLIRTLLLMLACLGGELVLAQVAGNIVVYPTDSSIETGSTRQFSAYVPISPNTVTWAVNDIIGGNSAVGTVTQTGLYTPPTVAPTPNTVVIKVTSTAYPTSFGMANVTITRPYPWLWSVYPNPLKVGNYEISLNGSNFAADSVALANGTPLVTTYVSATKLTAKGTATQTGNIVFSVRQPAPGTVTGNTVSVKVNAAAVSVTVSPSTATVELGKTQAFASSVTGTANTAVTWSVNNVNGGNATVGTISSAGAYTAPATMPSASTVTIRAKSVANTSAVGQATVTLKAPAQVNVSVMPATASVELGNTQSFSATVTGSMNTAVTWAVNGVAGGSTTTGTISSAGVYTAPATMPGSPTVTIRATSAASSTAFGQATVTLTSPSQVQVSVSPSAATVELAKTQSFSATVTGNMNTSVTWAVNGVAGGSATTGTISSAGLYTAPANMPASPTITIRATSVADSTAFGQATVTLTAAPQVTVTVAPALATVELSKTQSFAATVTGNANTAVTWAVNGVAGGSSTTGTITTAGLYTAPASMPASSTVTIRATSVAVGTAFGQATVTLTTPPPPNPSGLISAGRFLEQSSFGPTPATLAKVQQVGIEAYLDEQFSLPETVIPAPSGNSMGTLRQWMLYNYSTADDQLRQRVAYALSQIVVTSGSKLVYADEILPWLRLLSKHAFGNYRDLLKDVTMSPSMGKFLDLANSLKPGLGGGANENYPRELMQLFSIGLWQLNMDGSQTSVRSYDETTVKQVALALTGWTYATAPGSSPRATNWEYFGAPMETREGNHDTTAKSFLGCSLPANRTVMQDMNDTIDCIFEHPNVAPFISIRLIRSLVTSNPSPAYVQRVANVFANNGAGVRGDLKAVITAILLDPEARQDVPTANQGRLKEPILHLVGFARALNGRFSANNGVAYVFDNMAQPVLSPPSVFSWFSPLYRIPKSSLFGPEFQIYTPTEATLRGNFIYQMLGQSGDTPIDLTPFQPYGSNMSALVDAVDRALLYGRMSPEMKQVLITAATPGYDAKARIETVLYLTALSGQYAVQH